jgi:hypothetical protein
MNMEEVRIHNVKEELSEDDIRRLRRVLCCNVLVKYSLIPLDWQNPKNDTKFHTAQTEYELLSEILVPYSSNAEGGAEKISLTRKNLLMLLMTASEKKSVQSLLMLYHSLAACCGFDVHELIPPCLKAATSLHSQTAFLIWQTLEKSKQEAHGLSDSHLAMVDNYYKNDDTQSIVGKTMKSLVYSQKIALPIKPVTNYYRAAYITKSWGDTAHVAVLCTSAFQNKAPLKEKKAILLAMAVLTYQDEITSKLISTGATLNDLPDDIKAPCKKFVSNFVTKRREERVEPSSDSNDVHQDAFDYFLENLLRKLEEEQPEMNVASATSKCCLKM